MRHLINLTMLMMLMQVNALAVQRGETRLLAETRPRWVFESSQNKMKKMIERNKAEIFYLISTFVPLKQAWALAGKLQLAMRPMLTELL